MTRIYVKLKREGWHSWPAAPDKRSYLRSQHRHQFHVKVSMDVFHDERDVEFHDLMDEVDEVLPLRGPQGTGDSCETMARIVCTVLAERYPGRRIEVDISEDGEAGAVVNEENL